MAASAKYPATEEMVRALWDRQQISDVMLRAGTIWTTNTITRQGR